MRTPYPNYQNPCGWNALLPPAPVRSSLSGNTSCDLIVVGGGYTGLAAARRWHELEPTRFTSGPDVYTGHTCTEASIVDEDEKELAYKYLVRAGASALLPIERFVDGLVEFVGEADLGDFGGNTRFVGSFRDGCQKVSKLFVGEALFELSFSLSFKELSELLFGALAPFEFQSSATFPSADHVEHGLASGFWN